MPFAAVRTPEDRFANLPDFPWTPHYTDALPGFEGLRMARIDEGPRDGHVVLCLHGAAELVVPLPEDAPGVPGSRAPRHRTRPLRLRPL